MLIQILEDFNDGRFKFFNCAEVVVIQGALFQIAPQAFDVVEFRAVFGKPKNKDVILMLCQEIQRGLCHMVACIIQDEDEIALLVVLEKLAEELVELSRVLFRMDKIVDLPGLEVERPVDAVLFVRPRSRDFGSFAAEGPDFGQGRVEMNLTLIKEEEVEGGALFERAFFKKRRNSFFSSYSTSSRRWPMIWRGRR
jgi:hypothetical protein